MKQLSLEVRVGLVILAALVLAGILIFALGGITIGETYTVYVDFNHPGNVQPGAAVNVGNVRIGRVSAVEYLGGRHVDPQTGRRPLIRMTMDLETKHRDTIHEDALVYVTSTSLVGESLLAIEPGSPDKPIVAEGEVLQGVDPPRMELAFAMAYELLSGMTRLFRENREELDSLLSAASNMVRSLDALMTRHSDRIDRIIENIETITTDANELVSGANDMVNGPEVRRIVHNVDHTMASVSRDIDPLLVDARSIAGKVDTMLDMIGPDQQREIQSTIHDASEIAHDANGMVDQAGEIVTHIRQGRGTAGALLMDEEIYDDIQEMLRDLKHNPWKLFWRE